MKNGQHPPSGEDSTGVSPLETRADANAPGVNTRQLNHIRDQSAFDAWPEFARRRGWWLMSFFLGHGLNRVMAQKLTKDALMRFRRFTSGFSSPRDRAARWLIDMAKFVWIELHHNWRSVPEVQALASITAEYFAAALLTKLALEGTSQRLWSVDPQHAERDLRIFCQMTLGHPHAEIAQDEGLSDPEVIKIFIKVQTIFREEVANLTKGRP